MRLEAQGIAFLLSFFLTYKGLNCNNIFLSLKQYQKKIHETPVPHFSPHHPGRYRYKPPVLPDRRTDGSKAPILPTSQPLSRILASQVWKPRHPAMPPRFMLCTVLLTPTSLLVRFHSRSPVSANSKRQRELYLILCRNYQIDGFIVGPRSNVTHKTYQERGAQLSIHHFTVNNAPLVLPATDHEGPKMRVLGNSVGP